MKLKYFLIAVIIVLVIAAVFIFVTSFQEPKLIVQEHNFSYSTGDFEEQPTGSGKQIIPDPKAFPINGNN